MENSSLLSAAGELIVRYRAGGPGWLEVLNELVQDECEPVLLFIYDEWCIAPDQVPEFPSMVNEALAYAVGISAHMSGVCKELLDAMQKRNPQAVHASGLPPYMDALPAELWGQAGRWLSDKDIASLSLVNRQVNDFATGLSEDREEDWLEIFEHWRRGQNGAEWNTVCEKATLVITAANGIREYLAPMGGTTVRSDFIELDEPPAAGRLARVKKRFLYESERQPDADVRRRQLAGGQECNVLLSQAKHLVRLAMAVDVEAELRKVYYGRSPSEEIIDKVSTQVTVIERCLDFVPFTTSALSTVRMMLAQADRRGTGPISAINQFRVAVVKAVETFPLR